MPNKIQLILMGLGMLAGYTLADVLAGTATTGTLVVLTLCVAVITGILLRPRIRRSDNAEP